MTIFDKEPLRLFVERLPNGKLKAVATYTNTANGKPLFEGSGYEDVPSMLTAIRLNGWLSERQAAGIELVYPQQSRNT